MRTTTTDRLLYNTGEQTQVNAVRDFVDLGAGAFESGQGRAVGGRFTPSRLEDAGAGSHIRTGALRTFTLSRYTLTLNVP
ncbi:hypothetical protein [Streptomyces abikoensis]